MNEKITLNFRYLTDPERINRILPPPLEPDDEPMVSVFYMVFKMDEDSRDAYFSDRYVESGLHVSAKYRGHRGAFQVGMPLNQDWGRTQGRETFAYHKKDGDVVLERSGDTVRGKLFRRGNVIHQTETKVTDEIAHPRDWPHEYGYGTFMYRFRLHPDWRQGTD